MTAKSVPLPIPTFPACRRLEPTDRAAIEAVTTRFPPYSDFNFTSLWAWDTDERCLISRLNGNLAVRFKDFTGDDHFWSFLGDQAVTETAEALLAHARREGLPARLGLVPRATVVADDRLRRRLRVRADEDNFDYVYALADWAALPGRPFRTQRRQVARCRGRAPLRFRMLDLDDRAEQAELVALFGRWAACKPVADDADHELELAALRRGFRLAGDGRLEGCGLDDGGGLVAFSLWEGLPGGEYAVCHFRKNDRSHEGLSAVLRHAESRVLLERGYRWMNVEQDLGIANLRRYKRSLNPCGFLRKYVISERGDGTRG